VGESEERAVLAGEFEEHAENNRAVEQLYRAACARASTCVQAGSHGTNVARCMRAQLEVWSGACGVHTQQRVLLCTRTNPSAHTRYSEYSRGAYPAEGTLVYSH
jgi:hypothetical protein